MPEFNVIQSPELIRRIRQGLGMRQAHTTPTLSETVQVVVIADDLRDQRGEQAFFQRQAIGAADITPVPPNFPSGYLLNPAGSGRIIRVQEIRVASASVGPVQFQIAHLRAASTPLVPTFSSLGEFFVDTLPTGPSLEAPQGQVSVQSTAGYQGNAHSGYIVTANAPQIIRFERPTALYPDAYLSVGVNDTGGVMTSFMFRWTEEPLSP